jgi:membrane protein
VAATILWLVASLLFKVYVANFTDYEASYGTVGAVIVVLLWFYVSGIAILAGAELNAEIEHASPYGKAPGQKNAEGKRLIGTRAARWYEKHKSDGESLPVKTPNQRKAGPFGPAHPQTRPRDAKPGLGAAVMALVLAARLWNRRGWRADKRDLTNAP